MKVKQSIVWQILLPIPLVCGVAIIAAAFLLPPLIARHTVEDAIEAARATVDEIKTVRTYYTRQVVAKVTKGSTIQAAVDHQSRPDAIPLPATMVHDLGGLLQQHGTSVKLYSPYPFPNREGRRLDAFGNAAWDYLTKNPDSVFARRETIGGKEVVRVALADRLVDQSCVTCHDSYPHSPKTDWKLGDVRGVMEVDTDIDAPLARGAALTRLILLAAGLVAGVLAVIALLLARRISMPVKSLTAAMQQLAAGESEVAVPAIDRGDEVGTMAAAVVVFKENAVKARALEAQRQQEEAAKEARQQRIEAHIAAFERSVQAALGAFGVAAAEMQATAQGMSAAAEQTSRQASAIAEASEQASGNVQTVAAATEEMSSSITEIGRQIAQSGEIASQAVEEAARTGTSMQQLDQAAQKIGEVVKLINDIASQTNLLALNATIEAARAGEAGKGFAVVASEVKNLAAQTARATEEIGSQIGAVQGASKDAVEAMARIDRTIGRINEIAAAIATSIEEQGATTREITRSTQEAATDAGEVARNIVGLDQGASATGRAAGQVLASAGSLAKQAETLRAEVDQFLANIRAA